MGDLVDRGPESADVLKWLERPWFHAICGNHDLMTWRRAIRFRTSIIASTAADGWMPVLVRFVNALRPA
ncbi:metallophosphoesterase [Bordetella hinzii]|uniref:metallophosphoesterase n=1 Tax=Bordetella hinzii TaxID=103855 RepID=UPI0013001939|nr:metallophosphoesterase [Bordetella hinzii]MBZ0074391.1 metallophosphoesterase [Bordetella hinzii]MBZ0080338.1 metallophosphoesterase [Bordetella hinzii]MBZ0083002.1 metallophosphoesterase [Bordetella hinzii]